MAKPVYDDGYSEERSDIADNLEARQEKKLTLRNRERDLELMRADISQKSSPNNNRPRGLSEVFFLTFPEEAEPLSPMLTHKTPPLVKKKSIAPSSRQRKQNKKVELSNSFVEIVDQAPKKPIKSVSRDNQLENQSQDNSHLPNDLRSIIGSVDVENRRGSYRSYQSIFDEESRPPPNIPAYYEYQQRTLKKRHRRRYIWELAFFGVYRRNTQLDDDIQTEILSVNTAT